VLGSAVIAGVGAGVFEDFTQGSLQMMRPHRVLEPNPEQHAVYREMYALYRDLYERVKPLFG
jgi:sugar (pentulose or hexulose) kinase